MKINLNQHREKPRSPSCRTAIESKGTGSRDVEPTTDDGTIRTKDERVRHMSLNG